MNHSEDYLPLAEWEHHKIIEKHWMFRCKIRDLENTLICGNKPLFIKIVFEHKEVSPEETAFCFDIFSLITKTKECIFIELKEAPTEMFTLLKDFLNIDHTQARTQIANISSMKLNETDKGFLTKYIDEAKKRETSTNPGIQNIKEVPKNSRIEVLGNPRSINANFIFINILEDKIQLENWEDIGFYEVLNSVMHAETIPEKDFMKLFEGQFVRNIQHFKCIKKYMGEPHHTRTAEDTLLIHFLQAIDALQSEISLYYWKQLTHSIGGALLAVTLLQTKLKNESKEMSKEKEKNMIRDYQRLANDVLYDCWETNKHKTYSLLVHESTELQQSYANISILTENRNFTQQLACISLNKKLWKHFNEVKEQMYDFNVLSRLESKPILKKLKHLFTAPSPQQRYYLEIVAFIIFLTAYSTLLISKLSATHTHWLEAIVIIYIICFQFKEYVQCCTSCLSEKELECDRYCCNLFNVMDNVSIVTAYIAWSLRWIALGVPENPTWMDTARYFLCFNFTLYIFRFMEFFYGHKYIGPILVMIRGMVKTYIPFLVVLMLFLVAYSIVSESILYPEAEMNAEVLYYVFRKGFWAMLGDYNLEELEATGESCTTNPALYNNHTMLRCPSGNGRYIIPLLLGIYALFIQIVMFSLIVALFNEAVIQNKEERSMVWNLQKFLLTEQYAGARFLLPPFTYLLFLLCHKSDQPFRFKYDKDITNELEDFEKKSAKKVINRLSEGNGLRFLQNKNEETSAQLGRLENLVATQHREIMQFLRESTQRSES